VRSVSSLVAGSSRSGGSGAARRDTETLERSRPFQWLVRAGFAARAITYAVIGVLALAMAVGAGTMGAAPNQQGALALIARATPGVVALVVICAGLLAYAIWKLTLGVFGRGPEGGGGSGLMDRVANIAGGIVYLGFFAVGVRVLSGSAGNSASETKHTAAGILGWPGGQLIVGVAGAALVAISLYQLYDAVRGSFAKDEKMQRMGGTERRVFMVLGHVGLSARALVFGLVGYFLIRTAIEFNPNNAVGLDGALARLQHEPLGPWVLGLAAAGLITFAAFSVLEARYRRL
jgi:uncharacterized protein DUF1206